MVYSFITNRSVILITVFIGIVCISCNVNEILGKHETVNNDIVITIDTCYISKYDEFKYICVNKLTNTSSDTFFLKNPKRILSIKIDCDLDTNFDAIILLNKAKILYDGELDKTPFIDYFPDILLSDSSRIYYDYFDSLLSSVEYDTLFPHSTKNILYVFQSTPYQYLSTNNVNQSGTIGKASLYIKIKSHNTKSGISWDYINISDARKIIELVGKEN